MIVTSAGRRPPFQMHSGDGRIRLRADELAVLQLDHLCTIDDAAVLDDAWPGACALRAGTTEWEGEYAGRRVSLAWDWIGTKGGSLQLLTAVPPRTNLMVIDSRGYDLAPTALSMTFWSFLETLDWQAAARAGALH